MVFQVHFRLVLIMEERERERERERADNKRHDWQEKTSR